MKAQASQGDRQMPRRHEVKEEGKKGKTERRREYISTLAEISVSG